MTRREDGIWTFTSSLVPPGAYRYNINVDGVAVIDPRNPLTSRRDYLSQFAPLLFQ